MSRRAIVLSFDRLALRCLGCCGNQWIETPDFDRLAAESIVFDQHFAENLAPAAAGHAWWTGRHEFPQPSRQRSEATLAGLLREAGVRSQVLIEHPNPSPVVPAPEFDSVIDVEGTDGLDADEAATPFAQLVVAAADSLRELASVDEPWLLWLKSRGVPRPWLPPREYATRYLDLFDHEAESEHEGQESDVRGHGSEEQSPRAAPRGDADAHESSNASSDRFIEFSPQEFERFLHSLSRLAEHAPGAPDGEHPPTSVEWRLARAVYAGYVTLLDRWLGRLIDAVRHYVDLHDLLVIITAAEGESLGERAEFPRHSARLAEEIVHTPLILWAGLPALWPGLPTGPLDRPQVAAAGGKAALEEIGVTEPRPPGALSHGMIGSRRQALVQTVDLAPTLLDWFGLAGETMPCEGRSLLPLVSDEKTAVREHLFLGDGDGSVAIRTPDFYLVRTAAQAGAVESEAESQNVRLFVKPDDVWEVNEVAAQAPGEVEALTARLDEFLHHF